MDEPGNYYITNGGGDSGFLKLNETTGDLSISRNDAIIRRWKERNLVDGGSTPYRVVAVDIQTGVEISSSTVLLVANLTDDEYDSGAVEFDRSLFSGHLASGKDFEFPAYSDLQV